ncbi:MAG: Ig-like domain-containing protein [Candidatus Dormiibacterota bacterium]
MALTGASATCTATYSTASTHEITATYSGDGNYQASPASAVLAESVTAIAVPVTGAPGTGGWAGCGCGLAEILVGLAVLGASWSAFRGSFGCGQHG